MAPHHAAIENNFLERRSLRRIVNHIQKPVLVVGGGQGLLVEELQRQGFQCDGVDRSPEMIKFAKLRRGLNLIEADAKSLPFKEGTYATIIYATGVIDFMGDEDLIRLILNEGRRVVRPSGTLFVAFGKLSRALEKFVSRVGLLSNGVLLHKKSLETYPLNPVQMLSWVSRQARTSRFSAAMILLHLSVFGTMREHLTALRLRKVFRNPAAASALINAAAETQPYRNEAEIRNLFQRLAIPIKHVFASPTCHIVQIGDR